MTIPENLTVFEIDEDGENCGKRFVKSKDRVISLFTYPEEVARLRPKLTEPFKFILTTEIGWLEYEKFPDYALANKSQWFLDILIETKGLSPKHFEMSYHNFRNEVADRIAQLLGNGSWGLGESIASRRGQDVFFIEVGVIDEPAWSVVLGVNEEDTWRTCLSVLPKVENFCETSLMQILKGDRSTTRGHNLRE